MKLNTVNVAGLRMKIKFKAAICREYFNTFYYRPDNLSDIFIMCVVTLFFPIVVFIHILESAKIEYKGKYMSKYEIRELMLPVFREIADNLGYPYIEPVFSDVFVEKFNNMDERTDMMEIYKVYLIDVNAKKLVL